MIIEKVINNNVVTAIDDTNQEVVLMGKESAAVSIFR